MFSPEVEARFKRIEDVQAVTAELQHRFEMKCDERPDRLEAIQNAMARWLGELNDKMNALTDAHIRLADTVERYLRSRTDGRSN